MTKYESIGTIRNIRDRKAEELAEELNKIIEDYGYSNEDALLCEIMYDSSANGSRLAKEHTSDMLKILRNEHEYKFLFDSIFDLSDMKNEGEYD